MYRSSPFRSTLNTGYIAGLDMCKVCTEAVHSVALWTRVTSQVWTCVKYVPKQSIAQRFEHVCECKRMSSSLPHPTLSHVMCARVTLGGKKDARLCLCVLVTPVCVRGWLWKMAVCERDSSLCARVTLGGKNDAKLCLCVLVTPECVRGWPPDPTDPPEKKGPWLLKLYRGIYYQTASLYGD